MSAFAILNRNAIKQLLSFIDQSNVISLDSPAQISATVRYDAALAKANELLSARVIGILLPECSLFNASYSVHYMFQYPNQTRRVSIDEWRNPVRLYDILNPSETRSPQGGEEVHETPDGSVVNPMDPFSARDAQVSSYGTVMQAFSTLLIGRSSNDRYNGDTTDHTSWKIIDINWSDGSVVQRALEQPFQNITLSVLSDQSLIKNSSTSEEVPVAVTTWSVTYIYSASGLLIPYFVALFCALCTSVVGLRAFVKNGGSYQNLF